MNNLENDIRELLFMVVIGWIMSLCVSLLILIIYWFGFGYGEWNLELTLLLCWNLGVIGILIILTLISVFLHRFAIVSKERLEELTNK